MKKITILYLIIQIVITQATAQMMRPSIMVIPSDVWCKENGYYHTSSPDYKMALSSCVDLINVISKINNLMSDRGFPLENLESILKSLTTSEVENAMIKSQEDGSRLQESLLDQLYRLAQTDIVLQLTWSINAIGPKHSVTFNLQALDSYTNKQVAGAEGTGEPSFSADVPILLEEAVLSHIDVFCQRLMEHFKDIKENGREIALDIRLFDSTEVNFETEYDDYELAEVITNWLGTECVNHRFSRGPSTTTMLQFRQVRIPTVDKNGIPTDAYSFARNMVRFLRKAPYNLPVKVIPRGLGKAIIIIGEK